MHNELAAQNIQFFNDGKLIIDLVPEVVVSTFQS